MPELTLGLLFSGGAASSLPQAAPRKLVGLIGCGVAPHLRHPVEGAAAVMAEGATTNVRALV